MAPIPLFPPLLQTASSPRLRPQPHRIPCPATATAHLTGILATEARAFDHHDREHFQVHVDDRTSLVNAVQMNERVLAGIRAADAFQLFNPEVLARKVEAEAALRAAIERIDLRIVEANEWIAETQEELVAVQWALAPGPDAIRVGPSINRRAVDRDQVIFPSNAIMPDEGVAPDRKMTMTTKLRSRKKDSESQSAFWDLNLRALMKKEALQAEYRDGLVQLREEFSREALVEGTHIGCGFSDYTFRF